MPKNMFVQNSKVDGIYCIRISFIDLCLNMGTEYMYVPIDKYNAIKSNTHTRASDRNVICHALQKQNKKVTTLITTLSDNFSRIFFSLAIY